MADLAKTRGRKALNNFNPGDRIWIDASYFDDLKVSSTSTFFMNITLFSFFPIIIIPTLLV